MFLNKWIVFVFVLCVKELACVRVTELRMIPPAVQSGSRVIMQCLYELDKEALYCVKWYRGFLEFYRYCPSDNPPGRGFPPIRVDDSLSNATQIVITNVEPYLAGQFTCEVSADAPSFHTVQVSSNMEVVSIPQGGPVIVSELSVYQPGDMLRVNCSVPPSMPKSKITMFINDEQIKSTSLKYREAENGLLKGQLHVSLVLRSKDFAKGPPVLKCSANILDLYSQFAELPLKSSRGPPTLSRVTSNTSSRSRFRHFFDAAISYTIFVLYRAFS